MNRKLLIIDGSSLLYRAFFALPPLTNKEGIATGAVYGFTNMLLKLWQEQPFDLVCVAFDKSRKTFRTDIYPEYKATRQATPPELREQFVIMQDLLTYLGITSIEADNFEADDIIGTIAATADKHDIKTTILTGDRDSLQLVSEHTHVLLTKKGISDLKCYTLADIQAEYNNLTPKQLIDIKGLMGDKSDNIPGIAGIGEKTALKLITEHQSLELLLANIDTLPANKLKEKLIAQADMAILSKKLATIDTNVPLECDLESFKLTGQPDKLQTLLSKLEFRNVNERLLKIFHQNTLPAEINATEELPVQLIEYTTEDSTAIDLVKLLQKDQKQPIIFIGEYIGEFPFWQFSSLSVYFNNTHYNITEDLLTVATYILQAPNTKITIEAKNFFQACLNNDISLEEDNIIVDLAIMAYIVDVTDTDYSLDNMCKNYSDSPQNCLANMLNIYTNLDKLVQEKDLEDLLYKIELPLVPVLSKMEYYGISVEPAKLSAMGKELVEELKNLETKIYDAAGEEFNINSPKQLSYILFDKLQLPILKKTKTGASTDITVLEKLMNRHEIIPLIIEQRSLAKLNSTYLEGLGNIINPVSHKIHTHFQQTVTATGRLSSTNPNLQNIPIRTPLGKKIREFFVPSQGYDYLVSFDYSQIELRILADMSKDEILTDAFLKNQDIHTRTAAEVFNLPIDAVPPAMRSRAKAVNFGIVYGISDYGLATDLKISNAEAAEYIKGYFARYAGVKKFIDSTIVQAKATGYVKTMYNRQRYLPDINSSVFMRRSFAERTAINTPIQGSAADIIKIAMIEVDKVIKKLNLQSRLLIQVHDELLLEVPEKELTIVLQHVQDAMQKVAKLSVPLLVDYAYGKNWSDSK